MLVCVAERATAGSLASKARGAPGVEDPIREVRDILGAERVDLGGLSLVLLGTA